MLFMLFGILIHVFMKLCDDEGINKVTIYSDHKSILYFIKLISESKKRIDIYGNLETLSLDLDLSNIFHNFKINGIKIRYIIDISGNNVDICKKLNEICEIHHMSGLKGNFILNEREYICINHPKIHSSFEKDKENNIHIICTNVKEIVTQQQCIFDTFWNNSIPALEKINEIEKYKKDIYFEPKNVLIHVQDHNHATCIFKNNIDNAKSEVLIAFTSIAYLLFLDKTIDLTNIIKNAKNRDVSVIIFYRQKIDDDDIYPQHKLKDIEIQQQLFFAAIKQHAQIKNILELDGNILVTDNTTVLAINSSKITETDIMAYDKNNYKVTGIYSNYTNIVNNFGNLIHALWSEKETINSIFAAKNQIIDSYNQVTINKEQKEINKIQKDLIDITAHELRTPIQIIEGYIELALEDKRYNAFDSQNGNFLHIIQSNASRLSLLIDQTLDIAKIENNSLHLNKLRCNLNKEIQTIVDEYNTKLLKSKYKIYDDNDSQIRILFSRLDTIHPIFVNMDKLRIYQVITNLINNSIKSIEDKNDHIVNDDDNNKKKDGVITISIKLLKSPLNIYKDDNSKSYNLTNNIYNDVTNSHGKYEKQETKQFAIINIKDSGKGISKEIMSKIFTKFGSFSDKGVGFGLFISKHIIEAHGGKIWAQNNFNNEKNGATFSFSLPVI